MCGIAGVLSLQAGFKDINIKKTLKKMTDIIRYRGPNGEGFYSDQRIGLGMRRLSIIDIAGGDQPIYNEDGTLVLVFNGEIYNYLELRKTLLQKGHCFQTESDTETIVHLYEEYGNGFIQYLNGMFAFALWDRKKEKMILCRDRLGVKPLYYHNNGTYLSFASEIKSILQNNWVQAEVDIEAMDALLSYNYCPGELTMFKGIKKVNPGSCLVFEKGILKKEKYWDLPRYTNREETQENKIVEEMFDILEDAVRIRLRSDVPLGAFLSGGIDSSTVVGLMSKLMDRPVKTFSIGFSDERFNELPYADMVAGLFKTDHCTKVVDFDVINLLPKSIWHCDNPHGDVSFLPTYQLSSLASQYVTVVLTGDGGDELFAGYEKYADFYKNESRLVGDSRIDKYLNSTAVFDQELKDMLYSPSFKKKTGGYIPYKLFYEAVQGYEEKDFTDQMLYADMKLLLEGNNLIKPDRMGMAVSIEPRGPFLDYRLVEYVAALPSSLKLREGEKKYILKKGLESFLPREIIYRKKQMFTVPIGEWFKSSLKELVYSVLLDKKTLERGYFNADQLKKMLDDHVGGAANYTRQIRLLLVLELWHRMFIDHSFIQAPDLDKLAIKV